MAVIPMESNMRAITVEEIGQINDWVSDFERRVQRGDKRWLVKLKHNFTYVDSKNFELYMYFLKDCLREDGDDDGDDDGEQPEADFVRIHDLRSQKDITAFLDGVLKDGQTKTTTLNWIIDAWQKIGENGAVFRRLRLLGTLLYQGLFDPLECKTGIRWDILPKKYRKAILTLEELMTCEVERLIVRFQQRQAGHLPPCSIWYNKCSLMAVMLFVHQLAIPVKHRKGNPVSVEAYKDWLQKPMEYLDWTDDDWKLVHRIYGEEWNDGHGKFPNDVLKVVLRQIMGPKCRIKFVKFIWCQTNFDLAAWTTVLRKKQVLVFPSLLVDSIPVSFQCLAGRFLLFGLFEATTVPLEDGTLDPHTFWSRFLKSTMDEEGAIRIHVHQLDKRRNCEWTHPVKPPPQAYSLIYNLMGPAYW